jgi:hypothetical protein
MKYLYSLETRIKTAMSLAFNRINPFHSNIRRKNRIEIIKLLMANQNIRIEMKVVLERMNPGICTRRSGKIKWLPK